MHPIVAIRFRHLALALLGSTVLSAEAAVEVTGVEGETLANVLAYLTLDDEPCLLEERVVRREFRGLDVQVLEALEAFGYYEAEIETRLEFSEACWTASIAIDPGAPVLLRTVDIELTGAAREDAAFTTALERANLVAGAQLDHGRYDRAKTRLQDLARTRGYAQARYTTSRLDVYPMEHVADVTLHFDSGPRYRFGDVTLIQDALEDDFIWSFLDLSKGDPYDNARLASAYVDLSNSGYFETVDIRSLPPDAETQTIPIEISLTATPRRLISYGVGFSTDTGPRFRFGRTIRRWNDRGHQFAIDSQVSPVISELTANYRMPFGDPRYEWLSFDTGIKHEKTDTSTSESLEFGVRRVAERTGGWTRTQMLNLLVEDYEVGDQLGRSRLLMPGVNFTRLRGDDTLRPTRGSRLSFEVRGGDESLGSDTSFVQLIATTKWIRSFGGGGRVLLRGEAGSTEKDVFGELPPSVRFFAGGDNSVRGYGYESLGPVDANGEVIGGSRLLVASAEYEFPIKPKWSFALFVDSGNAFEGTSFDAKTSAGFGARWQSPLGPVRIDVGVPMNDPDHGPRLHVNLGPDL